MLNNVQSATLPSARTCPSLTGNYLDLDLDLIGKWQDGICCWRRCQPLPLSMTGSQAVLIKRKPVLTRMVGYNCARCELPQARQDRWLSRATAPRSGAGVLPVAQWIVHMPPKRGILVRFQSGGPDTPAAPPHISPSGTKCPYCCVNPIASNQKSCSV